jgi:hypothetical protein
MSLTTTFKITTDNNKLPITLTVESINVLDLIDILNDTDKVKSYSTEDELGFSIVIKEGLIDKYNYDFD